MSSLGLKVQQVKILKVEVSEDSLAIDLSDGRSVSVPLAWYPRLLHGTPQERRNWRLIAGGEGIHWPALDEDLSMESILFGRASAESQTSLKQWLQSRPISKQRRSSMPKRVRQPHGAGRQAVHHG